MAHTLLCLTGPSSSGKTTLARLLPSIFPHTLTLHEDDFYLPETLLPKRAGFLDWDCAAALNIPALVSALTHIKTSGTLPPSLISKEAQNAVGESGVSETAVAALRAEVETWLCGRGNGLVSAEKKIILVDGFLLVGTSVPEVRDALDIKILLRATFAKAKRRREARAGYVTLEGFWEDPPGYMEAVVWPGFVEEHGELFLGGDVEGRVDEGVARKWGVTICPGEGEWGVEESLRWVVRTVMEGLEDRAKAE